MDTLTRIMAPPTGKSYFNLDHDHRTTMNMGELTPIMCEDVIPNDYLNLGTTAMVRFQPLVAPVMHRIKLRTHTFFVPNRIMWDGWEGFITHNDERDNNPREQPSTATLESMSTATELAFRLGFPLGMPSTQEVLIYPFIAYIMIWNEYYRDQDLVDEIEMTIEDGNDNDWVEPYAVDNPLRCSWRHDYFTSCRPWAQKGDPVTLPLGTSADVVLKDGTFLPGEAPIITDLSGNPQTDTVHQTMYAGTAGWLHVVKQDTLAYRSLIDPNGTLEADLSNASSATVGALRIAFAMQTYYERDARSGTRYVEWLYSHWQTAIEDHRVQRPEYICGSTGWVTISEVLSTTQTLDSTNAVTTPVGNLAGHGISISGGYNCKYLVKEHGWILTLATIIPESSYHQGLPRKFTRFDQFDYALPEFAHIGEQEVLNKEIYVKDQTQEDLDSVFGYQRRFGEYTIGIDRISGDMAETLLFWNLSREFASAPALNSDFIEVNWNNQTRIFASSSGQQIICHFRNSFNGTRQLPKFGVPKLIG